MPGGPERADDVGQLAAALRTPAMWEDPPAGVEEALVAAIAAEAPQVRGARWRRARRRARPLLAAALGAAAAAVVLVAAVALDLVQVQLPAGEDAAPVAVVLHATGQAPGDARAEARMRDGRNGTRIELRVTGLPPVGEDEWYEMTLVRGDGAAVSAGSFHLRGGGDRVLLWAGVDVPADVEVEVTREPAGVPVLSGALDGS